MQHYFAYRRLIRHLGDACDEAMAFACSALVAIFFASANRALRRDDDRHGGERRPKGAAFSLANT
ncbi:hypothetical protein [Limimaricola pyoseonensis]|uniref:hypothetical protein n=1 Tax=Limimaricola pyoseonensis TaxID=521013 RepID=UPI0010420CA3|nr:hypothetical protein [Limimaricola pyoseonensis]